MGLTQAYRKFTLMHQLAHHAPLRSWVDLGPKPNHVLLHCVRRQKRCESGMSSKRNKLTIVAVDHEVVLVVVPLLLRGALYEQLRPAPDEPQLQALLDDRRLGALRAQSRADLRARVCARAEQTAGQVCEWEPRALHPCLVSQVCLGFFDLFWVFLSAMCMPPKSEQHTTTTTRL